MTVLLKGNVAIGVEDDLGTVGRPVLVAIEAWALRETHHPLTRRVEHVEVGVAAIPQHQRTAEGELGCPRGPVPGTGRAVAPAVCFRGGAEAVIRQGIVQCDLFEAVIGLAPNLFYGASIPVAVCVLNRAKPPERKGKVLFIDAAQPGYYREGKAQNHLDPEHREKIVAAFRGFEAVERFAHVADLAEIAANDWNLNIGRYVDTTVAEVQADIGEALRRLRERERDAAVKRMDALLAELGYSQGS